MVEKYYFDILNGVGVTHECDGRTDRQTDTQWEPSLPARSKDPRYNDEQKQFSYTKEKNHCLAFLTAD